MLSTLLFKTIEWCIVAAAVLTYIEIGPGGEAIGDIVSTIKSTLITIQWGEVTQSVIGNLKQLFEGTV